MLDEVKLNMREFLVEDQLRKTLAKLFKRDKVTYEAIMAKMNEIVSCLDVSHYKNLRSPMQEFKRVHIRGSFVLIFKYNFSDDKIIFYDFDHHDTIYT